MEPTKSDPDLPRLSVEWLRTFKGFENISEHEAEKALATIRSLAQILMGIYNTPKQNPLRNEKF